MKITVLKQAHIDTIPSASAVEVLNGNIYVVGDDSCFLYVLKYDLSLIVKVPLYEVPAEDMTGNRILKKKKADLECITRFNINGYPHLLILGSGAESPRRDVAFLVKLPTPYNRNHKVWNINLEKWYSFLRLDEEVTGPSGVLNFEAAACDQNYLFLFNRENNAALRFDLPEFIEFIQGHTEGVPFPTVIPCELPNIKDIRSGLSGADLFDGILFITASAENTSNAIDDGEIMGSAIGILSLEGENKTRGGSEAFAQTGRKYYSGFNQFKGIIEAFELIEARSADGPLKIESVCVYEKEGTSTYIAVAVSDDDKGGSEILMLQIDL